jgi:murein DD-endopeptidase MepM/ murein hydrolase activator NlpD
MVISRRQVLVSLLAGVQAAALDPVRRAFAFTDSSTLSVRNFGDTGRAALTEGETLLVEIAFGGVANSVEGAFPIAITPPSAGGELLVEPQPLYFYPGSDGATWRTILSAPLDSVGQRGTLRVAALVQVVRQEWTFEYESLPGDYRRSFLRLSRETTDPSREIAERKRREFESNAALLSLRTPRLWDGEFAPAVPYASRNNFGLHRTVNGTLQYRHAGIDSPAPIGTRVRAINDGRVALSGVQWTPGQIIILDHGGGIFSRYLHLSDRHVAEGELVRRGDVIGLSGNTGGQKPGPHLHLDSFVNGTPVNLQSLRHTASQLMELERAYGAQ